MVSGWSQTRERCQRFNHRPVLDIQSTGTVMVKASHFTQQQTATEKIEFMPGQPGTLMVLSCGMLVASSVSHQYRGFSFLFQLKWENTQTNVGMGGKPDTQAG